MGLGAALGTRGLNSDTSQDYAWCCALIRENEIRMPVSSVRWKGSLYSSLYKVLIWSYAHFAAFQKEWDGKMGDTSEITSYRVVNVALLR